MSYRSKESLAYEQLKYGETCLKMDDKFVGLNPIIGFFQEMMGQYAKDWRHP